MSKSSLLHRLWGDRTTGATAEIIMSTRNSRRSGGVRPGASGARGTTQETKVFKKARRRALARLRRGLNLQWTPEQSREKFHARGWLIPGTRATRAGRHVARADRQVVQGPAMSIRSKSRPAADLAGIEKVHQLGIAATVSRDPVALTDPWTDDAVRLTPGQPAEVGKQAIRERNERGVRSRPALKVLSYVRKPGI